VKIGKFTDGQPFWAVVDQDAGSATPLVGMLADWAPALTGDPQSPPPFAGAARALEDLRLLAPVDETSKVIAAGATYAKHIAGLGLQMPKQPAAFIKPVQSLVGPEDEISYPPITEQLDYEGELVAVIGAVDLDRARPLASVLGYTVGNEVSARDLQFGGSVTGMDVFSGKALDRTSPVGPWIVTRDEFGDGSPDLALTVTVDGEQRQCDRTGSLVWGVDELLEWVNARSGLHAGDLLFTGTPAGVGHEDGRYLQTGQVVTVEIEGIGTLRNAVGARS
jgi:2-keto-4-pentenoate hydratase/2-oxohepta-3-ene-1,7-dioic acid hydratase in catechol pathway